MTDSADPANPPSALQDGSAHLDGTVATMRAVLVQLLQEVVTAESRLRPEQATELLKANEALILSALAAQTEVESAHGALYDASRVSEIDPLTALPNRTLLLDRFESAIFNAKRHGNRVALLFVDLDAFKQINDSFGHAAGDQALQSVAACLKSLVRETDTVSRHGGDEFLILLAEVSEPQDAANVAGKVNAALAAHAQGDDRATNLAASIGISLYPDDGEDPRALIELADMAMYLAKKQGSGTYVFHGQQLPGSRFFPALGLVRPAAPLLRNAPTEYELSVMEHQQRSVHLREANEALVLSALGAQELLAAAAKSRTRQDELLRMVVDELSDPFAPIRLAAAGLGMTGAERELLARLQGVVESQAEKLSRMVREVLEPHSANPDVPSSP